MQKNIKGLIFLEGCDSHFPGHFVDIAMPFKKLSESIAEPFKTAERELIYGKAYLSLGERFEITIDGFMVKFKSNMQ